MTGTQGHKEKPEAMREEEESGQRGRRKPRGLSCLSNLRADAWGPGVQTAWPRTLSSHGHSPGGGAGASSTETEDFGVS